MSEKKIKKRRIAPMICTIISVILVIVGMIEPGKSIDSNMFLFGLIWLLFALHLLNSNDIDKLKENKK